MLLYDSKGRFLLQQRDDEKDAPKIENPETWGLFGGSIKKQELPLICLKRELDEEINLDYKSLKKSRQISKKPLLKTPKHYNFIYLAKFVGRKKYLCQHEGQGMGWFSQNEIHQLKLAVEDRILFAEFFHDYKWKYGKYLKVAQKINYL